MVQKIASSQPSAFLLFDIGKDNGAAGASQGGTFGLDVRQVAHVLEPTTIASVPLAPRVVVGIMNHHGRIVTVVDPAVMLDLHEQERPVAQVVVVEHRRHGIANLGLQVSSIRGIVAPDELQKADVSAGPTVSWVAQLGMRLVHIVALNSLVERLGQQFGTLSYEGRDSGVSP